VDQRSAGTRETTLLTGGLAAAGGIAAPAIIGARAQSARPIPTPAQTAGPFYPTIFPPDIDDDLVVLRGSDARASGTVAHVRGRVLGRDGRPLADARVEIWQCDARGVYRHPDSGGFGPPDQAFQGFGRTQTRPDGSYGFRTIRPVAYPGRTPHIHFAVSAPGRRLVTQMYVAGEPLNDRDGLYRSLGRARDAVTVRLEPANGIEVGALAGEFDIVL
jgi:protocatechuate 3,4-dioxygenase beta subunit